MSGSEAREWGASGLAHLTGRPDGAPDFSRAAVLRQAASLADDLAGRLGIDVSAAELLAGRAGLLGLSRRGRVSAGGASRLLRAADGWWALTLSRPDDVDAVPALVELDVVPDDPWRAVESWCATCDVADVVDRSRLLGLPAAALGEASPAGPVIRRLGPRAAPRPVPGLLVVDLSSMWAGPLCGQLLARAGATVVKVETPGRPDGTRAGDRRFFDWMNAGKLCYSADLAEKTRALLETADVVIESSRPAALRQRGLGAEDVAAQPGRVWLRITGYGADVDRANWTAFGDDAAVAGGVVGRSVDGPVFCGDAIADPLTGMQAALQVAESLARGGGEVIDVAMASVAATYAMLPESASETDLPAMPPAAPVVCQRAGDLGADDALVERLVAERA
ncbi:CoA transferase [Mycolicibacterium madagascariense]|uniref:CoA transferase n=1 Tax=Mycolicibacterium madagascariense TaxID=212765 RepID=A0A7I7XC51_9MYCO|nr:CoA transferase [Mycolicibacterium madagascariense]MCV7011946.1 CoA transferase [Mycolicibacterium madagascariense]BBZ26201.1 CoA transferase [Mycolicibacterium madagascariense]